MALINAWKTFTKLYSFNPTEHKSASHSNNFPFQSTSGNWILFCIYLIQYSFFFYYNFQHNNPLIIVFSKNTRPSVKASITNLHFISDLEIWKSHSIYTIMLLCIFNFFTKTFVPNFIIDFWTPLYTICCLWKYFVSVLQKDCFRTDEKLP